MSATDLITPEYLSGNGFEYNEDLETYQISDVLYYDVDNFTLKCYDEREDSMIAISYEVKTEKQFETFYEVLFNSDMPKG